MSEIFHTKKSLGQHFLTSPSIPRIMCDAANIQEGDTVLEIGPGTGVLTKEILNRGAHVIALETDPRALEVLNEVFKAEVACGNLRLEYADVRKLDLSTLGLVDHSYKVVANIPYYLSGMLFRMFLESPIQPNTLVYLVQKEVAQRISATHEKGKKESLLSLSASVYGDVSYVHTVSRNHFNPPPKVDSAIVAISNISRANFIDIEESFFFETLHLGFRQKRKQLLGNLSAQYNRETLTNIFSALTLPLTVRAEDIPLTTWISLIKLLSTQS